MKYWKGTMSTLPVAILAGLLVLVTGCTEPPVASFTTDKTNVAAGEAVQFTNSSTGEVTSWSWDFGDGNTSTQQNPFHTYNEKGSYTASLAVFNKAGSDTATLAIIVRGPPVASFTTDETKVAVGDTVQFTNSSTGEVNSLSWDFGDGNTSTQENPSHAYAEKGNYTASLTVSNKAGSDTATSAITVLEPPRANFSASETRVKLDTSIQFTDESGGDVDSWSWDFGDGNTSTEQNPSPTYKDTGTYTVSLTVSNAISSDTRAKKDYVTIRNFVVSRMVMCSSVTEEGDYTPQPDATYHVGDLSWVYFEITGFEQPKTNGNYEVWVQWREFKLYNPDGTLLAALADVSEMHDTVDRIVPFVSFWIPLGEAESSDPLGEYRVEVTVEDKLAGDTATGSIIFILE
jgi:PKD repeat protein